MCAKQYKYVFDANFFISMNRVKARQPLKHLLDAKKEIGCEFFTSIQVYHELPRYSRGTRASNFKKTIEVVDIKDVNIQWVKDDLENMGIKQYLHAQDPDLSLIALSKKLRNNDAKVFLVSDDFKLSENVRTLQYGFEFLSLSAFVLFLSRKSQTGKLKAYFKDLQKKILKYNLQYMLSRKERYNPINKMMFLIENSVKMSQEGFDLRGIETKAADAEAGRFKNVCIDDLEALDQKSQQVQKLCNQYINEGDADDLNEIILMIPLLDEIKKSRRYIAAAKDALKEDETKQAISSLKSARNNLMNALQLSGSILPRNQYDIYQKVVCTELSTCEFLRAFLYIGLNDMSMAIEALDTTATYATMGHIKRSVLAINYLKALILIFNGLYEKAIEQYRFMETLAANYAAGQLLILKATIGRAVTMFLAERRTEAVELIDEISSKIREADLENAIIVFQELGDYFYAISNPKIAISLYREALECAVDSSDSKWKVGFILDKMKRAYMNSLLEGSMTDQSTNIDTIIDRAHELQNVEEFNEAIQELAQFNAMMYSDLEYTEKNKTATYFDLDDALKENFDVIDILESKGTTVLIGFNKEIGLIGFRIKLEHKLMGMPENYTIKIKKNARIKIIKPSQKLKAKYLIRGIIVVTEKGVDIDRNIPVFFSQMNL